LDKRNDVLSEITRYLIQYRRVSIPHIGSFELIEESPRLDIADKLFHAPVFTTRYSGQESVSAHQLQYISGHNEVAGNAEEQLVWFGDQWRAAIEQERFNWKGVGTLSYSSGSILFDPESIQLPALQPVPAQKVMRHNSNHQMLVGDQEVGSHQMPAMLRLKRARFSLPVLIALIILILAIAGILVWLYLHNFQLTASGSQWKATGMAVLRQTDFLPS
jgi:hypothetical protein